MARHRESRERARGPSQRQLRAGELIRHAVAEVLTREELRHEDLIDVAITVTEVVMSPDLRQATCYIMPLGGKDVDKVLAALARTSSWLSGQVAKRVRLKFAPRLRFRLDQSFDNAARIDALLKRDETTAAVSNDDDLPGMKDGDDGA